MMFWNSLGRKIFFSIFCVLLPSLTTAQNNTLKTISVSKNVYALVGSLTNRAPENLGNNATFGFIITKGGVVLVDSGGSLQGAEAIHDAIKKITDKPVKFVINSGGQDHRWFGNSYFKKLGAKVISSKVAKEDHEKRLSSQWDRLETLIGKNKIEGTVPEYADITFDKDYSFTLGDTKIHLYHRGQAHTPGDTFIWLPKERIMFTGDIVYLERMLGVGEQSNSKSWLKAFEAMASYQPKIIIPGHGHPATLSKAIESTYNYLKFLRESVTSFIDKDGEMSELNNIDQSKYKYLHNFDSLKGRNIQKVYSEIEFE